MFPGAAVSSTRFTGWSCNAADDVAQGRPLGRGPFSLAVADQAVDRGSTPRRRRRIRQNSQFLPAECHRPHGAFDGVCCRSRWYRPRRSASRGRPPGTGRSGWRDAISLRPGSRVRVFSSQSLRSCSSSGQGPRSGGSAAAGSRWLAVDPLLDGVELADPGPSALAGQRRGAASSMDVVELAPGTCAQHAASTNATAPHTDRRTRHSRRPCKYAAEPRPGAPLGCSPRRVGRVAIAHRRRAPCRHRGPLVAQVGPQPPGAGLAGARRQHRKPACRRHAGGRARQGHGARVSPPAGRISADAWPDPVGKGRALELHALAGIDLGTGGRAAGGRRTWATSTCASSPAPARPRRIGRLGAGAWVMVSQGPAGETSAARGE